MERNILDNAIWALDNTRNWLITEVVSGGAKGVDALGEVWAHEAALPLKCFPADWEKYGKSAGFRRNREMALYADALLAIWDGKSRGTKHMIRIMKAMGKPLFIYEVGNLSS